MNSHSKRRLMHLKFGLIAFGLLGAGLFAAWPASARELLAANQQVPVRFQPKNPYFYFDTEDAADGSLLPNPPFAPYAFNQSIRGKVAADARVRLGCRRTEHQGTVSRDQVRSTPRGPAQGILSAGSSSRRRPGSL